MSVDLSLEENLRKLVTDLLPYYMDLENPCKLIYPHFRTEKKVTFSELMARVLHGCLVPLHSIILFSPFSRDSYHGQFWLGCHHFASGPYQLPRKHTVISNHLSKRLNCKCISSVPCQLFLLLNYKKFWNFIEINLWLVIYSLEVARNLFIMYRCTN